MFTLPGDVKAESGNCPAWRGTARETVREILDSKRLSRIAMTLHLRASDIGVNSARKSKLCYIINVFIQFALPML